MHPNPTEYFEYRLQCLDDYLARPTVLGIYDVAGWLRQLLLDATPLMDVVNRNYRIRIRFEVNTLPPAVAEEIQAHNGVAHLGPGLSPRRTRLDAPTRMLTRDGFLKEPILLTGWGEAISVRELILWAANEAGGVHYAPEADGTSLKLGRLMAAFDSSERPVLASSILTVARVVRDGLEPMRAVIATDLPLEG